MTNEGYDKGLIIQNEAPILTISNPDTGEELLSIHRDGTVTGSVENASEAGRLFVDYLRDHYAGVFLTKLEVGEDK